MQNSDFSARRIGFYSNRCRTGLRSFRRISRTTHSSSSSPPCKHDTPAGIAYLKQRDTLAIELLELLTHSHSKAVLSILIQHGLDFPWAVRAFSKKKGVSLARYAIQWRQDEFLEEILDLIGCLSEPEATTCLRLAYETCNMRAASLLQQVHPFLPKTLDEFYFFLNTTTIP